MENILIVDDTPDNLRLLSVILGDRGYKIRKALNGQTAIKTVQTLAPDLILLDINMPEMNGYEVCQLLKTDAQTQEIPVIFISALDDVLDKVKAFHVGGVDYITKPFQEAEVIARVENHLTLCRQHKQLQAQNEQLQREIGDREKAENALRVYLHAVSHDLRNPLVGMSMVLQNLLKGQSVSERESHAQAISIGRSVLERMESSCDRQLKLINSLVETQQFDVWGIPLQCQPLHLAYLTQDLIAEWQPLLAQNQAILDNRIALELPLVYADRDRLWRVLDNLIANAIKHNFPGVTIIVDAEVVKLPADTSLDAGNSMIRCTVTDNGSGINPEQVEDLFELYRRGKSVKRTAGLGLGLYLCRQIINAHQGEIGVETSANQGAQFWFTLPVVR